MLKSFKALNHIARNAWPKNLLGMSAIARSLQRGDNRAALHSARLFTENVTNCRQCVAVGHSLTQQNTLSARLFSSDAKGSAENVEKDRPDENKSDVNKEDRQDTQGAPEKSATDTDHAAKIAELESQLKAKTELVTKLSDENKELKNRCSPFF